MWIPHILCALGAEGPGLLAGRFYGTLNGKQKERGAETSMDESTPVNLKPLECRSNRPHQFSTANGIFVTKIEPGRIVSNDVWKNESNK